MPLDQNISELSAVPSWADNYLVIIGRPNDGKLFKSTLGELKAYINGTAGISRLTTPGFIITSVTPTVINFRVVGDIRTEKFIVRLSLDSAFNSVIRNTTITLPQLTGQFTGLDPATTYYLDVVSQSTGYTNSLAGIITSGTTAIIVNYFPYSLPISF